MRENAVSRFGWKPTLSSFLCETSCTYFLTDSRCFCIFGCGCWYITCYRVRILLCLKDIVKNRVSILKTRFGTNTDFRSNGNISCWFQEGRAFQKCIWLQLSTQLERMLFSDIANLTIMTASDNTVVTVALSAIQSDTVALFCGSVLIEYYRIAWIHVA